MGCIREVTKKKHFLFIPLFAAFVLCAGHSSAFLCASTFQNFYDGRKAFFFSRKPPAISHSKTYAPFLRKGKFRQTLSLTAESRNLRDARDVYVSAPEKGALLSIHQNTK